MKLLVKIRNAFKYKSNRDRYLGEAADLVDLEFRMKQWDKMELERARGFQDRIF